MPDWVKEGPLAGVAVMTHPPDAGRFVIGTDPVVTPGAQLG